MVHEKMENFWYYYKWYIIAGFFVFLCLVIGVTQCTKTRLPDFSVSYIAKEQIDGTKLDENGLLFSNAVPDRNHNNRSDVDLNIYVYPQSGTDREQFLAETKIITEVTAGYSRLYICDINLLRSIIDLDMCRALNGLVQDTYLQDAYRLDDGTAIGISVEGNTLLERMGLNTQSKYLVLRKPSEKGKLKPDEERAFQEMAPAIAEYIASFTPSGEN